MISFSPEECIVPREIQLKVLVIGEYGVGKTALIQRYTKGHFNPNYKLTIGVDFAVKTLTWDSKTKIHLQLWDIAGHERFGHLTRVYYKYAVAAIVVFDLTRPTTLDEVAKWVCDVRSKLPQSPGHFPVVLVASKCDAPHASLSPGRLDAFCRTHAVDAWFATSARQDINVDSTMAWLVERLLAEGSRRQSLAGTPPMSQHSSPRLSSPHLSSPHLSSPYASPLPGSPPPPANSNPASPPPNKPAAASCCR